MKKFETIDVEILGKKYNTIKPSAMQVIKLEDECVGRNGVNLPKMIEGYLQFVDKKLTLESFDKEVKDLTIKVGEELLIIKDFDTRKKLEISSIISGGKIDRVGIVEKVISLADTKLNLDELKYSEINEIFECTYKEIDIEEVVSAQEQIASFLQS